jgi:hypothetical protein
MPGQRQQQVVLQFGVNVSTIERLVRRLRDTGRVVDPPRVTTPRQDRAIHLAHLRNRHVTATETTLTTVGNYNRHNHPKTEKPIARVWSASSSTLHWFSSHSCTSRASYGLVGGTWSQTISNEAMETGLFHILVAVHSFSSGRSTSCIPTSWGTLHRRLRS